MHTRMPRKLFHPATWFGSDQVGRTREIVRLLNARDCKALEQAVADDIVYYDTAGAEIRGRAAVLAAMREMYRMAGDIQIETDEIFQQEGEVHVKGRLLGSDPDYRSESLWRFKFDTDDRVEEMQAFRERNAVSVPRLTAHLRRKQSAA